MVMRSNETMSADDCAILETNSDSIDGVRVRQTDTGLLHAFVGVADAAITSGSYGLIQVYGYRSTSRVFQTNTSPVGPNSATFFASGIQFFPLSSTSG